MRISDWSSDVCSSDLTASHDPGISAADDEELLGHELEYGHLAEAVRQLSCSTSRHAGDDEALLAPATIRRAAEARHRDRSEERRVGKECVSPGRSRGWPSH